MHKQIREAVRCYLIKDNKVVVTKYKSGNKKEGYYDIPGGKIEEGETPEEESIRKVKEETGLKVKNQKYKGKMIIEYPNIIFSLSVFLSCEYEGEPKEVEENSSEWIDIDKLLQKERKLPNIILLEKYYKKGLIDDRCNFWMKIKVDEDENILNLEYNLEEEKKDGR